MTRLPFLLEDLAKEIQTIAPEHQPEIEVLLSGPVWLAVVSELASHFNRPFSEMVTGKHEAKIDAVTIRCSDG